VAIYPSILGVCLTDGIHYIPFFLLICIFDVFFTDSYEDHIYGRIETGYNSQYWKMAILTVMAKFVWVKLVVGAFSKYSEMHINSKNSL
jgi:hypothetical protein